MVSVFDVVTPAVAAVTLAALWAAEAAVPFFTHHKDRAGHGARNIALGLINGGLRALLFPAILFGLAGWVAKNHVGLLNWLDIPGWAKLIAAVLILDAWGYGWHVLSHNIPLFWRFHAVHHHDEAVDSTTAFRFHAGDILLTSVATLLAMVVFGLTVQQILVYELILLPTSIFHHSNIRLPERIDRALRLAVVTPRMHWVHHSRWQPETDSNYSSVFSWWDRLFGTLRLRRDPGTLRIGLDGYSDTDTRTLRGCLATPLGPIKSLPGAPPADVQPVVFPAEIPAIGFTTRAIPGRNAQGPTRSRPAAPARGPRVPGRTLGRCDPPSPSPSPEPISTPPAR